MDYTHIELPAALVNQLVNYLQTRPYREVAGYLTAIESQGKAVDKNEEKEEEVLDGVHATS